VDRKGRAEPLDVPVRMYTSARLSPDGTRIALDIRDQDGDIWIWDIRRRTLTRFTFEPAPDQYPIWTPDGKRIVFSSSRVNGSGLFWQVTDGAGTAERLTETSNPQMANAISPDGMHLVLSDNSPKTLGDLVRIPLNSPRNAERLIATPFAEGNADISADGRWIAYQSNESGKDEVFVRPFPNVNSGRWQVSNAGGSRPTWAKNGRELFYLEGANTMRAVPIETTGTAFSAGNPVKLFEGQFFAGPAGRLYDVTRDGQRFLMIKDMASTNQAAAPLSMVVVLNWQEELRQRVPER
jgi:Tol biopolymer transport system component